MNSKAFKNRILPLSQRIFPMAARMLTDEEEARDAVQEIMIKLWNKRKELGNHPNIPGFVFLLARNYCLDQLRKRNIAEANKAYQELIADVYEDQGINDFKELSKIVLQIIETLPENQKEVMQLRDLDGFEFEEIAAITKLKIEHIRVLLSRARIQVRIELEKIYSYEPRRK